MFELACCYDQMNLSLAAFELLFQRWQLILGAHARNPLQPDYNASELFTGLSASRIGVAPALSRVVARRFREDAEVEAMRQNVRENRTAPATRNPKGTPKGGAVAGATEK